MNDQNQSSNPPKKDQSIKDQVALLSFIDELLKEKKDPKITPQNINQIRVILLKQLNDDINRHLVNLMPEKDQLEFDVYLDSNPTDDQIAEFFKKKIPNIEAEVASVLINFRAAYLYPLGQPRQDLKPSQSPSIRQERKSDDLLPAPPMPVDKTLN